MKKELLDQIEGAVDRQRLIDTAISLIEVPSPTRSAGPAADRLAEILTAEGFPVQRHQADWPQSPIVLASLDSGRPGPTLQFDGHLDTVHLPYVPPRLENDILYGSSSADMKGGIAAALEALRVLRALEALPAGKVILTAHDHHEGPWGDGRQVRAMIREGLVGDAVLLPEYLANPLPMAGKGLAIFQAVIRREGVPVHEVLRPSGTPDVVAAGALLVSRLHAWNEKLKQVSHPLAGHDSTFVGSIQAGEIYNQSPTECRVHGTRRWVPPADGATVKEEFLQFIARVAAETGTEIEVEFDIPGGAYQIEPDNPFVHAFQNAHSDLTGAPLPLGAKPFVDDGNVYASMAGIPAITHGPDATGAHTHNEAVPVEELVRIAKLYALTAVEFCGMH